MAHAKRSCRKSSRPAGRYDGNNYTDERRYLHARRRRRIAKAGRRAARKGRK
jgi:hypothetical protein